MSLTHDELREIDQRRSQEDLKTLIAYARETLGTEPAPEVELGLNADGEPELEEPAAAEELEELEEGADEDDADDLSDVDATDTDGVEKEEEL